MLEPDRYCTGAGIEDQKTAGCMASTLECNMWLRARTPGNLTYEVSETCTALFSADELMLPAGSKSTRDVYAGRPILRFLGAKVAHFLHDYHHDQIGHSVLDAPNGQHNQLTKDDITHLLGRIHHGSGRTPGLLEIVKILKIGHKDFLGKQFIRGCQPDKGAKAKFGGSVSGTDFVFFIPPPPFYSGDRRDFKAGLERCWYGRVVLLFKMKVETDDFSGSPGETPQEFSCAMIEVLYDYRPGQRPPGTDWDQFGSTGTKMVYLPAPDSWHRGEAGAAAPVVYIVPVDAILGRLPLSPAGVNGTIPCTMKPLRQRAYPEGTCDLDDQPGSGSKVFYINSWAMQWASDHPIRSAADWAAETA